MMRRDSILILALTLGAAAAHAQDDAQFVQAAAASGLAEVDLGRLAADRGAGAEVRGFGQMMVEDHERANRELAQLAAKKGLALPAAAPDSARAEFVRLDNLTGRDFDLTYLRATVSGRERALALFTEEAQAGTDPDIKAWAAKTLPSIKGHLSTARNIQH